MYIIAKGVGRKEGEGGTDICQIQTLTYGEMGTQEQERCHEISQLQFLFKLSIHIKRILQSLKGIHLCPRHRRASSVAVINKKKLKHPP